MMQQDHARAAADADRERHAAAPAAHAEPARAALGAPVLDPPGVSAFPPHGRIMPGRGLQGHARAAQTGAARRRWGRGHRVRASADGRRPPCERDLGEMGGERLLRTGEGLGCGADSGVGRQDGWLSIWARWSRPR